jgi:hypothetical protein
MKVYTYSEARKKLAALLDQAQAGVDVRVRRRDGQEFTIKPTQKTESPLAVEGVDLSLSAREIVDVVREVRER